MNYQPIPKAIRERLEAMSLADLDVLATILGDTAKSHYDSEMAIKVAWISAVMTEKITNVFE